jgi:glycosyltransferase involved in cell wall biosynthesis
MLAVHPSLITPNTDGSAQDSKLVVLIPVFNDWRSLGLLFHELDRVLASRSMKVEIIVVDDASNESFDSAQLAQQSFLAIEKISVLELTRNLGHQRAIAVGLAYLAANVHCRCTLIMDADGEDDPRDVPRLIETCEASGFTRMIFARRAKRNESRIFKLFYTAYKGFYRLLTGHSIAVGNFSIVPFSVLCRLVSVSEIWNHYAVGVKKAKIPTEEIVTDRGKRLAGKSGMNFVSLVVHGLSSISVFGDVIGVRLLIATVVVMMLAIMGIGVTFFIRLTTTLAIPGWATYLSAALAIIALQAFILSLCFIFIILNSRNNVSFLPSRDYPPFVLGLQTVYPPS